MTNFLSHNLSYPDLYDPAALERLDSLFLSYLEEDLKSRLQHARKNHPDKITASALLLDLAPYVEDFIGALFYIATDVQALQDQTYHLAPLYRCKRLFVQRQAAKAYTKEEALHFNGSQLRQQLMGDEY